MNQTIYCELWKRPDELFQSRFDAPHPVSFWSFVFTEITIPAFFGSFPILLPVLKQPNDYFRFEPSLSYLLHSRIFQKQQLQILSKNNEYLSLLDASDGLSLPAVIDI